MTPDHVAEDLARGDASTAPLSQFQASLVQAATPFSRAARRARGFSPSHGSSTTSTRARFMYAMQQRARSTSNNQQEHHAHCTGLTMAKKRVIASAARKFRASRRGSPAPIPAEQWRLPAGYHRDRKGFATLRHVVDPDTPTVDGSDLSDEQRTELTSERIKRQKRFNLGVLGTGVIDKKRALEEVQKRTAIGRALIDVEQRAIRLLREYLAQHAATAASPRSGSRRPTSTTSQALGTASRPRPTQRRRSVAPKRRSTASKKKRR
ncbi:MAG: hypothetical protein DMF84_03090 [Acidobacteria bacterium]|nr:MAG: hypothetical protein DMF84_03090 [Acidobacteriota bacterium]